MAEFVSLEGAPDGWAVKAAFLAYETLDTGYWSYQLGLSITLPDGTNQTLSGVWVGDEPERRVRT